MADNQYPRVLAKFRNQAHLVKVSGFPQQTVSSWAATGKIPPKHFETIIEKARDEGIELSLLDFMPRAVDLIAPRQRQTSKRGAA